MRVLYATDGGRAAVGAGRLIEALTDSERVEVTVASIIATGRPELRQRRVAVR